MSKPRYNVQADGYHVQIPFTPEEVYEMVMKGKHINSFKLVHEKVEARSASFGKGGERIAFEGLFKRTEQEIVLKRFNKQRPFEVYLETIEKQMICMSMSCKFNSLKVSEKQIHFIPTTLFISNFFQGKYTNKTLDSDELKKLIETSGVFLVEPLLHGKFEKYNSNNGYIWMDTYHATPNAFSHWTWVESEQNFVIVDLQGVLIGNCYYLTDPAISSSTEDVFAFSPTNLGNGGIERFFATHQCNQICKASHIDEFIHQSQYINDELITDTLVNEHLPCVPLEPSKYLCKCVCIHPFDSTLSGDLTLELDDVVKITAKEGDWWTGECNGKRGIFPKNHVQEFLDIFQYTCQTSYEAHNEGEISVTEGDEVYLVGKKNGYVRVGLNDKFGYIPLSVVQPED